MNVYVIGDSISIHYGPFLKDFLHGVMGYARKEGTEKALRDLNLAQGANGGDSSRVLSFLEVKAATGGIDADLLLVNCGLHDIKVDIETDVRQVGIDQYASNLRAIIHQAGQMGVQLIWMRTTPLDEAVHRMHCKDFYRFEADAAAYAQVADEVMDAAGIPVIDLHAFTLNLGPDLYMDNVHFREPVRKIQAAYIAGWLSAFARR